MPVFKGLTKCITAVACHRQGDLTLVGPVGVLPKVTSTLDFRAFVPLHIMDRHSYVIRVAHKFVHGL